MALIVVGVAILGRFTIEGFREHEKGRLIGYLLTLAGTLAFLAIVMTCCVWFPETTGLILIMALFLAVVLHC